MREKVSSISRSLSLGTHIGILRNELEIGLDLSSLKGLQLPVLELSKQGSTFQSGPEMFVVYRRISFESIIV